MDGEFHSGGWIVAKWLSGLISAVWLDESAGERRPGWRTICWIEAHSDGEIGIHHTGESGIFYVSAEDEARVS